MDVYSGLSEQSLGIDGEGLRGFDDYLNVRKGEGVRTGTPDAFSEPDMLSAYTALGGVGFIHILPRPPPLRPEESPSKRVEGRFAPPLPWGRAYSLDASTRFENGKGCGFESRSGHH